MLVLDSIIKNTSLRIS